MTLQTELSVAKETAYLAGKIIRDYFEADQQTKFKGDGTPVTKADILVNKLVIDKLHQHFPNDSVIGEEISSIENNSERFWLCDPIDGTAGYIWGTPTAMFSLALIVNNRPVLGVVYDAFLDQLFYGIQNYGSYYNGKKLQVSKRTDLSKSHIAITADVKKIKEYEYISRLQTLGAYLPVFSGGVYKSCLVAKGKFEGYIEPDVSNHDVAAIQILVEEAGGRVTDLRGNELDYGKIFKGSIVSNGAVHDKLTLVCQDLVAT